MLKLPILSANDIIKLLLNEVRLYGLSRDILFHTRLETAAKSMKKG